MTQHPKSTNGAPIRESDRMLQTEHMDRMVDGLRAELEDRA